MMKVLGAATTFIAIAISFSAFGDNLEWQKINLEESINGRYSSALSVTLKRDEFLVKTEVKYNDPGMPKFDDLNETGIKVSDLPFDQSKGDYIAFSKVGLEMPVVEKMHKENQQRLKELYRYRESFDLFKNIESITVNVTVSDKLAPEKIEAAKNVIKTVEFSAGGVLAKATVKAANIRYIKPAVKEAPVEEGLSLKEIMDFIGKFGNAIGAILAVLLFGFMAYKLLKMYMEFLEKLKGMEEPKAEEEPKEDEQIEQASDELSDQEALEDMDMDEKPSFERFERLLQLNGNQAAILVKKWLNQGDEEAQLALSAAAQQLDHKSMGALFECMSGAEREKWNGLITGLLEPEDLDRANKIISEGVIKELVGGSFIDDMELVDIILSMDSRSVKSFIQKGGEHGKALANLLNPEVISEILNELSIEEMEKVVSDSLDFSFSQLENNLDGFKSALKEHCEINNARPFNQKLLQVVSEVSPEKETMIYKHIAKEASKNALVAVAMKRIPSDLVMNLPAAFLKVCMQNYPMDKKVKLLASLEENSRSELMGSFVEEGSNAKEMIDMELEALTEDQLQYKRVQSQKEGLWKEFLIYIRGAVGSNEEYRGEIEALVAQWVDKLREEANKAA